MNEPEHRVRAAGEAQLRQESCGRLAAQREAHAHQRFSQPGGASRMRWGKRWQPLGEDRAVAIGPVAPETPNMHLQSHRHALAGEIGEGAPVAALDPGGRMTAGRAAGVGSGGAQLHQQRAGLGPHALELQARCRKR